MPKQRKKMIDESHSSGQIRTFSPSLHACFSLHRSGLHHPGQTEAENVAEILLFMVYLRGACYSSHLGLLLTWWKQPRVCQFQCPICLKSSWTI